MDNKKSAEIKNVGVIIFVLGIIYFLCWCFGFPLPLFPFWLPLVWIGIGGFLQPLFWIFYLIAAFNILKLKDLGRIILIKFSIFVVAVSIICLLDVINCPPNYFNLINFGWLSPNFTNIVPRNHILQPIFMVIYLFSPILLSGFFWYFFTRSEVKEQFK